MFVLFFSLTWLCSDGIEVSPEDSIAASASQADLNKRLLILSRQRYPPASELPAIIDVIHQSDSETTKVLGLMALSAFKTRARQHAPFVAEMTHREHPVVIRRAAIESLFRCGGETSMLREVLNAAIVDEADASIRRIGIGLLSELGVRDVEAENAFVDCLEDVDPHVCKAAIDGVVQCGIVSDKVLKHIRVLAYDSRLRMTQDGLVPLCVDAIECLEAVGARDRETVVAFQDGLEGADLRVQVASAMALFRLSPKTRGASLATVCQAVIKGGNTEDQLYLVGRAIDASPQWDQRIEVLTRMSLIEDLHVQSYVELYFLRKGSDTRQFSNNLKEIAESVDSTAADKTRALKLLEKICGTRPMEK